MELADGTNQTATTTESYRIPDRGRDQMVEKKVDEKKRKLGIVIPTERFPKEMWPTVRPMRTILDDATDAKNAAQTIRGTNTQSINGIAKSLGLIRESDYGITQEAADEEASYAILSEDEKVAYDKAHPKVAKVEVTPEIAEMAALMSDPTTLEKMQAAARELGLLPEDEEVTS
jgi:hypothetical protein